MHMMHQQLATTAHFGLSKLMRGAASKTKCAAGDMSWGSPLPVLQALVMSSVFWPHLLA